MSNYKPPVHEKPKEAKQEIIKFLKKSFLTKALGMSNLNKLADAFFERKYKSGDVICKYGDKGEEYFLLSKGEVKVIVYNDGVRPKDPKLNEKILRTKILGEGICFGELALMYGDKRTATVEANKDC